MTGGGVFLRQGDALVAMVEEPYATEAILQKLLADYPDLLAGDQTPGDPRRWLFISQEVSLASDDTGSGRWYVDHLFIDQDSVPTLVEVKRSSDTRIRREVVGQILDYAANAVLYWDVDRLRAAFEAQCEKRGVSPDSALQDHAGPQADADQFWGLVRTNLRAGKLRLIFVGDEIPRELRRVVEFLNEQMNTTEVLAVEVKQYVGGGHQTLVPRLIGQTEAARHAKGANEGMTWDKTSVLEQIANKRNAEEAAAAAKIFTWAEQHGDLTFSYGTGRSDGSFQAGLNHNPGYLFPFALYGYGRVEIQFQWMLRRAPFDAIELRRELRSRLKAIPGSEIPDDALTKRPSIPLALLVTDEAIAAFCDSMDWAFQRAQAAAQSGSA